MGNCVINFKGETFETDAKGLKAFARSVSKQLPVHVAAKNQPIPVPVNPIETREINSATLTSAPEVIQNAKYVVIDTETSGLKSAAVSGRNARVSYDADEILQVSWLIMDANGKVLDRKTFIPVEAKERFKDATEIPNTNTHKIRPEHLKSETTIFSILDAYGALEELKNAGVTFVGQNIDFDVRMLEGAFKRNLDRDAIYTPIFSTDNIIDTLTLPGVKNKNFKKLEDLVNIPVGAHNASYDVEATAWLFISENPEINKQRSDVFINENKKVASVQTVEFFNFEASYNESTQPNNKAEEIKADIEKLEKEKQDLLNQPSKESKVKEVTPSKVDTYLGGPNQDGSFDSSSARMSFIPGASIMAFESIGNNKFAVYISKNDAAVKLALQYRDRRIDPVFEGASYFNPKAKEIQVIKPAIVELQGDKYVLVEKGLIDYDNVGINKSKETKTLPDTSKIDAQIAQKQDELKALESNQKFTPQEEVIESENIVIINLPTADSQYDLTAYENKTVYLLHPDLNASGMQVINPETSAGIINAISNTNPNIENPELNRVSTNLDLAAEDVILNAKLNTATPLEFFEALQADYAKLLDAVLDQDTLEHLQKILVRAALVELGVEEDINITDDYISILTKYDDQLEDPSIDPLRNLFDREFNPTCN